MYSYSGVAVPSNLVFKSKGNMGGRERKTTYKDNPRNASSAGIPWGSTAKTWKTVTVK
jgi:hypothetical protein